MTKINKNKIRPKICIIVISIIFITILFTPFTLAQNPNTTITYNNRTIGFFELFQWIFLAIAIFFVYVLYKRQKRTKQNKNRNKKNERRFIEQKQMNIIFSSKKTNDEKIYTCVNCKRKGTKKDFDWYQSKKSGEIFCEQCYKKTANTPIRYLKDI